MDLTLGWWNTGLSPTKCLNRAAGEELEAASAVVRLLLDFAKVDFLALAEVSAGDIAAIKTLLGHELEGFAVLETQNKAGKSSFDTSLIYRSQFSVIQRESVLRRKLERTTRVAQRFGVTFPDGGEIHVYLSHWPSRGTLPAWDPERMMLGNLLRESVDIIVENEPDSALILMGDFNDEPFDPVMDCALLSSRDKALVSESTRLLYNPFWRHMSCYEHENSEHQFVDRGTYFHAGGQITKWRTFDQMLFSASLVSGVSGWVLDESATRVVNVPDLEILIKQRSSVFDHLPVVGRIKRSESSD